MKKVLFLCTANSARSQMAEALLRHFAAGQFEVFSAGTEPDTVDPRALGALEAIGVDTGGLHCKSVDDFAGQHFDFVISLCSKAHRECSSWPGSGVVLAWDFDDPKTSHDRDAFRKTLHAISRRIQLFIEVNSKTTDSLYASLTAVDFYKALADETRLQSLVLLERELCVCELVEVLQQPQPKISRHLAQLRKAGLLLDRRQGQWVYYRLHPHMSDWMRQVIEITRDNNADFIREACKRLDAMPGKPDGGTVCLTQAENSQ